MNDICLLCEFPFSAMSTFCFCEKKKADNQSRASTMKSALSSSSLGNDTLSDSTTAKGWGPLRDWRFPDTENKAERLLTTREQF